MANSEPNKDLTPASTAAVAPADITSPPPVPTKTSASENDAPAIKEHTVASAPAELNGETQAPNANSPNADTTKASETLAHTEAPSVKQRKGEEPDGAAAEPALQASQNGGAGEAAKGDDAKSGGAVKPTLRIDHIREVSTASTMSASSPGTPGDEVPSSSVEKDDDGDVSKGNLTKAQKKRMREKARKQALKGEKNSPCPSSGATSNSVDNSVVQETKPVATAPVDIPVDVPVGEGEGVFVDGKTESGEDDAPVIVEKPEAATTSAEESTEKTTDDTADEEWGWW